MLSSKFSIPYTHLSEYTEAYLPILFSFDHMVLCQYNDKYKTYMDIY